MAHMIEDNKVFVVGEPAWHKLGIVLTEAPSIEAAWNLAYPHNIFEFASLAASQNEKGELELDDNGSPQFIRDEDSKYLIRDDGKILGHVGKGYCLQQPIEAFEFSRPYLESGMVELESGGSLNDGKRMWALSKIIGSESEVCKGDSVKAYLLFATSFDGSMACTVKNVSTRVVCNNTLSIARNEKGSRIDFHTARHTACLNQKLAVVQKDIMAMLEQFQRSVEAYKFLASKPASSMQLKAYVRDVIIPETMDRDKLSAKMETKVNRVIDLLDYQRGYDYVPAMHGTYWQGYNAITEYVTHEAGRNEDTRLNGQWFGENANLNQRALDLALAA